jgi:hypothetical protein
MAKLSIRQEYFVREYIKLGGHGKGAEAYRLLTEKYPRKQTGCKPISYRQCAHAMLKRYDVRQREQELRARMAKRADITEEKILSDYQDALNMARMNAKPAEMISAATAQAKLVGMLRDRVETGNVGDFENLNSTADILEKLGELVGPELALVAAKALGLEIEPQREDESEAEIEKGAPGLIDQAPPSDAVN